MWGVLHLRNLGRSLGSEHKFSNSVLAHFCTSLSLQKYSLFNYCVESHNGKYADS